MPGPRKFRQIRFARPPGATEVVLVRHGESEAAVEGQEFPLVGGHGDPPLSPEGERQAERVCARLADEGVDALYVTSLRRTTQTAAPLVRALGIAPVVEPDLREVFLGEWEGGRYRQKVMDGDPVALKMFEAQRYDVIPGAESPESLSERVRSALKRIAAAHPDQRVAVFSHGGVIGEILAQATRSDPFAFVGADNASVSIVVAMAGRWMIRRFNDVSHLTVD